MNKQEKSGFKSSSLTFNGGIGSSSILVIFVILCLVSFATLSIVSANADYKLSSKILDRTTAYYTAVNQAESNLANFDQTLQKVYAEADSEESYFATVGKTKSFMIPISDLQSLEIEIAILYPATEDLRLYEVQTWQVVNVKELDYDTTLNVIK